MEELLFLGEEQRPQWTRGQASQGPGRVRKAGRGAVTVCIRVDSELATSTNTSASRQNLSIQLSSSVVTSMPGLEATGVNQHQAQTRSSPSSCFDRPEAGRQGRRQPGGEYLGPLSLTGGIFTFAFHNIPNHLKMCFLLCVYHFYKDNDL